MVVERSFSSSSSPASPALAAAVIAVAAMAAGCATAPPPPAPAPQVQSLAQYMSEAARARTEQQSAKERDIYRAAARQYPTEKEPWTKLAESYFEAGDYGNAILAAQEVLQRDGNDALATGVLAVSGLRVSTQALSALRSRDSKLPADSRTQAEGLTKSLRELLGETVLVPQPAEPPPPPAPPPRAAAPRPARPPAAAAPAPKPPAAPAKNPFDVLK